VTFSGGYLDLEEQVDQFMMICLACINVFYENALELFLRLLLCYFLDNAFLRKELNWSKDFFGTKPRVEEEKQAKGSFIACFEFLLVFPLPYFTFHFFSCMNIEFNGDLVPPIVSHTIVYNPNLCGRQILCSDFMSHQYFLSNLMHWTLYT